MRIMYAKSCYNCFNRNCFIVYGVAVRKDIKEHHEHFEYTDFDCINHDKWEDCQNSPAVDNKSGKDCQHDDKKGGKYD